MACMLEGICPDPKQPDELIDKLNKTEFLQFKVIYYQGEYVSILELIRHCAHVLGGVHLGKPKSKKDESLSELQTIQINGATINILQLLPIVRVVVDALEELEQHVKMDMGIKTNGEVN